MSAIMIDVEFLPGTDIKKAITQAKALAAKFDVAYVKFNFNGIKMSIGRGCDVDSAASRYSEAVSIGDRNWVIA